MTKNYRLSSQYFNEVASANSGSQTWRSVRVFKTREISNDIAFETTRVNTLALDLSGTAQHLTDMDGKIDETPTNSGDLCQIPKNMPARFAWQTLASEQLSIVVEFDNKIFEDHCEELVSASFVTGHLIASNFSTKPEIGLLVRLLGRELDKTTMRGPLFAESLIRLLAIELAKSAWTKQPAAVHSCMLPDQRIHRAIEFIDANFATDISLLQLCRVTELRPTYLIELFKNQTGLTPYVYVVNRRLHHAVKLLRTTDLPICHIALDSGFSDQQQMTRLFSGRLGHTPKYFRKTHNDAMGKRVFIRPRVQRLEPQLT